MVNLQKLQGSLKVCKSHNYHTIALCAHTLPTGASVDPGAANSSPLHQRSWRAIGKAFVKSEEDPLVFIYNYDVATNRSSITVRISVDGTMLVDNVYSRLCNSAETNFACKKGIRHIEYHIESKYDTHSFGEEEERFGRLNHWELCRTIPLRSNI